ncbi:LON peptidase substrate-binding domain-containing protein [Catelliglobosispora koreensis]|uniref:LON peptidase substrate-binding domain-containing protein n=1 Tax=Catelliglobosispora koreensis TaxID=129052 RepID=UPI0004757598|nr:LON peptidase substrate-binding domain-containing protein [Catelliglobosispora koreensis]
MTGTLPLFPLGTVLFPGLVLPLHIFEDRWRSLVRHLRDLPDGTPREFGVVAIDKGLEVLPPPESGIAATEVVVHEVGCVAQVRQITEHSDGRFDLVTVGDRRFRITGFLETPHPYPVAGVEWLPEPAPDALANALAPQVRAAYTTYAELVRGGLADDLPEDPVVLSHLVAATSMLSIADRQSLLSAADPASRLRSELKFLTRETALLREVRAVPASLDQLGPKPSTN